MLTPAARRIGIAALLAAVLGLMAFPVSANVPTGEDSTLPDMITLVPDLFYWPGGASQNLIIVAGETGPIGGSLVELVFHSTAQTLVQWCGGNVLTSVSSPTDANGEVEFPLLGGGCLLGDDPNLGGAIDPVEVYADGILLGVCDINSPDVVNSSGINITHPSFTPDSSGGMPASRVLLGDAVFHTPAVINNLPQRCTVFTGEPVSAGVSLGDATIITNYVLNAAKCTL